MSKLLVTGGLGFIGSNLVKKLSEMELDVVVVDNRSSSREDANEVEMSLPEVEFINACYTDESLIRRIKEKEFDTVFHVAAIPRVSYSVENPTVTTDNNVAKTVKLMEACAGNIRRFVFSSSSSVYGGADILPTPNSHSKSPKSPYAWQKSCIEDLIEVFCNLYEFDAVSLRYFNVFGPGQFGGSAYATAISAWCHAIKTGGVLRKDGTGEQSRDMCYVDNVVNANILAMNSKKQFLGQKFNVACGDRTSNNQILDALTERFGKLSINNVPFRKGDVMHTQADISQTTAELGYTPSVRFWEGFKKTLEWWDLA
tara:strand:- start:21517 stop:22455 length:939 start_codon:yes stop_codon:yes gene_type:complete